MVSTPEVMIRFVGKGDLRGLGALVRRVYGDFRSQLKRKERAERRIGAERCEAAQEGIGDEPEGEIEVVAKARPARRWGRKRKPSADHPWHRSYMKK